MKDVNKSLRKGYVSRISGLTYLGDSIPCYASLNVPTPSGREFFYVVLSTQTDGDTESGKNNHQHEATMLLDVVYGSKGQGGSVSVLDDLVEILLEELVPIDGNDYLDLSADGLQILTTIKVSDINQDGINPPYTVWRRLIRISHKIHEL